MTLRGGAGSLLRLAIPAGALCVCAATEPNEPAAWIMCPFRLLTGLPCPLCGMTRGVAALVRGRVADAVAFHWFSPLALAGMAGWIVLECGHGLGWWNAAPAGRRAMRGEVWMTAFGVCLAYGVLRWWGIIESPRG